MRHAALHDELRGDVGPGLVQGVGEFADAVVEVRQAEHSAGGCAHTGGFESGDQVVFEGGADSSDPCQAGAGPSCPVGDVAVGFRFVGAPQVADGGGVGRGHDPVGQVHAAYADGGEEVGELCRFPWFHRAPFRVTSAIHRQICDKIHNYYYYEIEKKVVAWCYRNPR